MQWPFYVKFLIWLMLFLKMQFIHIFGIKISKMRWHPASIPPIWF